MQIHPMAGQTPAPSMLINVPELISAYYDKSPDPSIALQKVAFGTSGHRGSSLENSFNENHIIAISQAICLYRAEQHIDGPLFLGMDTHALSKPAWESALQVLAANGVTVMISEGTPYTPTPVISHAIISYNRGRKSELADGIVITPSHNPPNEGGFKYNPPHGGPAEEQVTNWIQDKANAFLENKLSGVLRVSLKQALGAPTTCMHNYMHVYVSDLKNVIDMDTICNSQIHIGVDPLGGAGIHYWKLIADTYGINLTVVNETIDPTFSFMKLDWDGKIRMDPSSPYAMRGLIDLKDRFDIAFACDTDYDRHGIVTKQAGLLTPNHYLSCAISYLFNHRKQWPKNLAVGKTLVSSQMIDRVSKKMGRTVYEVPVGFKWFVEGLLTGNLGFVGEESAGATFVRTDALTWTTDKDAIIMSLLAAEMTAKLGQDPGQIYADLVKEFGEPAYLRIEAHATVGEKKVLKNLTVSDLHPYHKLAGEDITAILTKAPGDDAPIGGIKIETANGWFAVRPSGTEDIYKIYGESFLGPEHLKHILDDAQSIVNDLLLSASEKSSKPSRA